MPIEHSPRRRYRRFFVRIAICLVLPVLVSCRAESPDAPTQAEASANAESQRADTTVPAAGQQTPEPSPAAQAESFDPSAVLPADFSLYDQEAISGGGFCVVGAKLTTDLAVQTPSVYRVSPDGRSASLWAELAVPEGHYQARATHCVEGDGGVYVLMQSDTRPERSLSQTFVFVYHLKNGSSVVSERYPVKPESANSAYSAWVDGADGAFAYTQGALRIRGEYALMSAPDETKTFSVELRPNPD